MQWVKDLEMEGVISDVQILTFMSSTKEGNPPIAMNVKNPDTYTSIEILACLQESCKFVMQVLI